MRQAWYGPLVQLGDVGAHIGCHVQLVVFILQCHPPEKLKTFKGSDVVKSTLFVGDSSCLHLKVSLWKDNARQEISAGDIVFLQNMKVAEFRGQIEMSSVPCSKVFTLLKRHDLLSNQGVESAMASCKQGPLVKEKLNLVICWVQQTQSGFVSFLNRASSNAMFQDKQFCEETDINGHAICQTVLAGQVRRCFSIAELAGIEAPCHVEFSAKIGEIYLPYMTNGPDVCLGPHGCILLSKHIFRKGGQRILRDLICIGCETCGSPLDMDHNGIYLKCDCRSMLSSDASKHERRKGRQGNWIFRPFYLHVSDQSGQTTVSVRHSAAVHMFASITAEKVFQSLQEDCNSDPHHVDKQQNVADDIIPVRHNFCIWRPNYAALLIFLLQTMLSKRNSPFHFRAICCHHMKEPLDYWKCRLNLFSFSLPTITEFRT